MSDTIQVAIVTVVAAGAFVTLVRPYLRRHDVKKDAPPCTNCVASAAPHPARPSASGRSVHH